MTPKLFLRDVDPKVNNSLGDRAYAKNRVCHLLLTHSFPKRMNTCNFFEVIKVIKYIWFGPCKFIVYCLFVKYDSII